MKRTLTGLATASILVALPLAASAHDNDGSRGWNGYEQRGAQYYPVKPKHYKHYQPPVVYYPPPRFVQRPVYVPAPMYVPAPPPAPRPWPSNQVDIGFRFFF